VAAILMQPGDEGHQHSVAYESRRKLTTAERNYPAHVLELLAVVNALRVFRHYLLGSGAPHTAGWWWQLVQLRPADGQTGTKTAPSPPVSPDDIFLSLSFKIVQTLAAELTVDAVFGP
jgi:hypothetical protein